MNNEQITSQEAASILGFTVQWVVKLVKAGKLYGYKMGRDWVISRESVEEFKARREEKKYSNDQEIKPKRSIYMDGL